MFTGKNFGILSFFSVTALILVCNLYLLESDMGGGISVYDFRNPEVRAAEELNSLIMLTTLTIGLPVLVSAIWIFLLLRSWGSSPVRKNTYFIFSLLIPLGITGLLFAADSSGAALKILGLISFISFPLGISLYAFALNLSMPGKMPVKKVLSWLGWAALAGLACYLLGAVITEKFDQPAGQYFFINLAGWCLVLYRFSIRWNRISKVAP